MEEDKKKVKAPAFLYRNNLTLANGKEYRVLAALREGKIQVVARNGDRKFRLEMPKNEGEKVIDGAMRSFLTH